MKKKIILTLMLFNIIGIALLFGGGVPVNPVVAEFSWANGYQDVYLLAGTYHFEWHSTVSTTIPFDYTNIWLNRAIISNELTIDSGYRSAEEAIINESNYAQSGSFNITQSGSYSIRAGTYACYACIVHTDRSDLVRTALSSSY